MKTYAIMYHQNKKLFTPAEVYRDVKGKSSQTSNAHPHPACQQWGSFIGMCALSCSRRELFHHTACGGGWDCVLGEFREGFFLRRSPGQPAGAVFFCHWQITVAQLDSGGSATPCSTQLARPGVRPAVWSTTPPRGGVSEQSPGSGVAGRARRQCTSGTRRRRRRRRRSGGRSRRGGCSSS